MNSITARTSRRRWWKVIEAVIVKSIAILVAGSLAALRLSSSHRYSSRASRYVKRRRYRHPSPHSRKKLA